MTPKTYTGFYSMHKYWSKKPYNLVSSFIDRFSEDGDVVLDPFCGSGITAVEALKSHRKAVAVDLNPVAIFITETSLNPVDLDGLRASFQAIEARLRDTITALYTTKCEKCRDSAALVTHTIWSNGTPTEIWYRCDSCNTKKAVKKPDRSDLQNISRIKRSSILYWYPQMELFENHRINAKAGMRVDQLFTKRSLHALAALFEAIEKVSDDSIRDHLRFCFTGALGQASKMVFVVRKRGKTSGTETSNKAEVGSWVIGYWIPNESFEINVWNCFKNRFARILRGKRDLYEMLPKPVIKAENFNDIKNGQADMLALNQSATDLPQIPDSSIDYIFTDPPHGDRIPYMELSLLWNSWLGFSPDYGSEVVISNSKSRRKGLKDYENGLRRAFAEMERVLKPGKYCSIAFNSLNDQVWDLLLSIFNSVGFEIVETGSMRYSANSVVQDTRKRGLKSDLVITCRKTGGATP
jgi:adenine-specific DNA methylase